jgi:hypothetical protein
MGRQDFSTNEYLDKRCGLFGAVLQGRHGFDGSKQSPVIPA